MKLSIRAIDETNSDLIKALKVNNNQTAEIETNEESIEEAKSNTLWQPSALYDHEELIGFAMYGEWVYEDQSKRVWLDRLMIDKSQQNKGYGKAIIQLLITHIFLLYDCDEIYLSVFETNTLARRLYEAFHFEYNGERDYGGELVMVLKNAADTSI